MTVYVGLMRECTRNAVEFDAYMAKIPSTRANHAVTRLAVFGKLTVRAVDKHGKTVDFLLRPDRGIAAAQTFFRKTLSTGLPRWPRKQDHARWPLAEPLGPSASAVGGSEVEVRSGEE